MERTTVIKTIPGGAGVPQKPVFDIKQPTPAVKDVSFSSYIKPEPNNQVDDSEISIFDAQKYFNDGAAGEAKMMSKRVSPVDGNVPNLERISPARCDFSSVPPRFSSASSSVDGYGRNYRASSFHATPTASSEASWNSQTGLLSNPPGAIAVSMRNPPRGEDRRRGSSSSRWLLGGRCPCSGKKSVQVEEKLSSEPRTPSRSAGHNSKVVSLNLKTHQSPNPVANTVEKRLITPADWLERREVPVVVPTTTHRISADNNRFTTGLAHHHHRVSASGRVPFTDGANGFTFPILSQTPTPAVKVGLNVLRSSTNHNPPPPPPPPLEDPARDSLEVFQPVNDLHHHHRRHSFTTAADDDMLSDASSDLFEIESFSTQTTTYPAMYNIMNRRDSLDDASSFNTRSCSLGGGGGGGAINGGGILHCRQSLDEAMIRTPSIAPTECYEPSEASFDWSVTTAEGFDRGSVTNFSVTASEVEEMNMMRHHHHHHVGGDHQKHNNSGGGGGGGKRKGGNIGGGGGLLMSCRCEKAVSVGPHPVKCVATEGQRGVSSTTRHVSSRPPPPSPPPIVSSSSKPPLARSHSARLSLPFAT